ncbi:amine oxidase family protein isoform 2 [Galdieria sulphuraria]|uniref:Amine oxidase family protein isoform 2 n=1 Tax=Galdieria sulphuraria TaxID=130081 RepID=M2X0Y6_GALSU|nr:amine oxidase family protein isoform 2 [Galdieria sulphuraria]EME30020.1 amine oxidase family protein isoform 2 [Galdieria sulphuraria]|eukprot:XP_005706540.1 amine oxidase family protein isoform 2 [Galdieria sulphuraria]
MSFVSCDMFLKPFNFKSSWRYGKLSVHNRNNYLLKRVSIFCKVQVAIIGGGIAGLTVASILQKYNVDYCLLEAKPYLGGRVATDNVKGFLLDHGFQVFIESYPEVKQFIDISSLSLQYFEPGALIRTNTGFHLVADPFRRPLSIFQSIQSPIGNLSDKLRVAWLRNRLSTSLIQRSHHKRFLSTEEYLESFGFSSSIMQQFFRPFLRGIYLSELEDQYFEDFLFIFSMFSKCYASLPAKGMGSIPAQLASSLDPHSIRLNTKVDSLRGRQLELNGDEQLMAQKVVIATDGPHASQLLGSASNIPSYSSSCCLYFSSSLPTPVSLPILILNGTVEISSSIINNICFPNKIAPSYAPSDRNLVSVNLRLDETELPLDELVTKAKNELEKWFDPDVVQEWQFLQSYRIDHALPKRTSSIISDPPPNKVSEDVFLCGDYCDSPTLNGAMASGRRTAIQVLSSLGMKDIHENDQVHFELVLTRNSDESMRRTREEYKKHCFLLISFLLLLTGCDKRKDVVTQSHLLPTNQCIPCPFYKNSNETCYCCFHPNQIRKNPKITALLAVRNVESTLFLGIRHLTEFCDSIVVLDDHSSDNTILELQLLSRYYPIEAIIYFTSQWSKRDELGDRQILLEMGRLLRSTHFVIIDYDEIFAADCVSNGRLREQILRLPRGHSLYIPWIFPWNGTRYHAKPLHTGLNLLNRSLSTIFADHESLEYPTTSSTRTSTEMSIHIGRIPNFRNGSKTTTWLANECKILDLRFVSLHNLEKKLLWYDALGRIFNVSRDVRGKVVDSL